MPENNIAQGVEELGVRIGIVAKTKDEWKDLVGFIPKLGEKIYITDLFDKEEKQMGYIIGDGKTLLSLFLDNSKVYHHLIEDRLAILESDPFDDFLETVEYNNDSGELIFTWNTKQNGSDEPKTATVDISGLLNNAYELIQAGGAETLGGNQQ